MTDCADTLVVLAKQPLPGKAKTRLQSAFSPEQAAALAAAALEDTLDTVLAARARRRVLAWQGDPAAARPGFVVAPQPDGDLNARLTAAFAAAFTVPAAMDRRAPATALLVGMDTPQLTAAHLDVDWEGADAVLGLSEDGGFWAIGLRAGHPAGIFDRVPMSTDRTGSAQLGRLFDLGLVVKLLPPLRDVDLPIDAEAVARDHPRLRFSRCYAEFVAGRPEQGCEAMFDRAYAGGSAVHSSADDGDPDVLAMELARWDAEADEVDDLVVARCQPPVIDLGCGPGRMVRALNQSGRAALGIDMSAVAVSVSMARGGPALRHRLEDLLPGEGRWGTALLMDSNVGIGGNVEALLTRCRELVGPGGLIICEVDPTSDRHDVHTVILHSEDRASTPMLWSRIGSRALAAIAGTLDLRLVEEWSSERRSFVTLRV